MVESRMQSKNLWHIKLSACFSGSTDSIGETSSRASTYRKTLHVATEIRNQSVDAWSKRIRSLSPLKKHSFFFYCKRFAIISLYLRLGSRIASIIPLNTIHLVNGRLDEWFHSVQMNYIKFYNVRCANEWMTSDYYILKLSLMCGSNGLTNEYEKQHTNPILIRNIKMQLTNWRVFILQLVFFLFIFFLFHFSIEGCVIHSRSHLFRHFKILSGRHRRWWASECCCDIFIPSKFQVCVHGISNFNAPFDELHASIVHVCVNMRKPASTHQNVDFYVFSLTRGTWPFRTQSAICVCVCVCRVFFAAAVGFTWFQFFIQFSVHNCTCHQHHHRVHAEANAESI